METALSFKTYFFHFTLKLFSIAGKIIVSMRKLDFNLKLDFRMSDRVVDNVVEQIKLNSRRSAAS